MSDKNQPTDGRPPSGATPHATGHEKRRVMVTQLLRSPVLNPAGEELGRLEDLIVKLDSGGGGYPPVTGVKGRIGGRDGFVGGKSIHKPAPREGGRQHPEAD